MTPHAIANLCYQGTALEGWQNGDSDDEDVESNETQVWEELLATNDGVDTNLGINLLIREQDLSTFIRENFNCKECAQPIKEQNIVTVRVGCACNVYWNCYFVQQTLWR